MIITEIIGGLGNQMFQYAMGYALAQHHGVEFRYDNRLFRQYTLHNGFELQRIFKITASKATKDDIHRLIGWRSSRIGRRLVNTKRLSFMAGRHYYKERCLSFNNEVFDLSGVCYLSGYWQSAHYFKAFEDEIHEQFRFKPPLDSSNEKVVNKIQETAKAVSLHVRRGDYVTNPQTNAGHGTCSVAYYDRALRYIEQRIENPVYFVFSDDVNWTQKNIKIDGEHYFISHNTGCDSYNDMRLMSLCNHHIIANSSFSWWGAWLNPRENKIVVAPDKWFQNSKWDSRDHVPASWVRL